jgi:hypothetical protein
MSKVLEGVISELVLILLNLDFESDRSWIKIERFLNDIHIPTRAKKCPNKQSVSAIGKQSWPQAQRNYMHDKVNHVTSEEAQQAQDVI